MAYYNVIGPDGQTYIVNAATPEAAKARVATLKKGSVGETDFQSWLNQPASSRTVSDADVAAYKKSYPQMVIDSDTQGTGNTAGGDGGGGDEIADRGDEALPWEAQFQRGLARRGIPIGENSVRSRFERDQQGNYADVFGIQQALQGFGDSRYGIDPTRETDQSELGKMFEEFVGQNSANSLNQRAAGLARQIYQRQPGPGTNSIFDQFDNPGGESALDRSRGLANLGYSALRSRLSPMALRFIDLPTGDDLYNQTLASGGAGAQTGLLDRWAKAFGLSRALRGGN